MTDQRPDAGNDSESTESAATPPEPEETEAAAEQAEDVADDAAEESAAEVTDAAADAADAAAVASWIVTDVRSLLGEGGVTELAFSGAELGRLVADLWYWLHNRLRAEASDRLGRLLVGDWALDSQLQRAIEDLSESDTASLKGVAEYKFIFDREFEVPESYDPEVLAKAREVK